MVLLIRFSQELILWDVNYKNKGEYTGIAESPYKIVSNLDGAEGWTIPEKLELSEGINTFTLKCESDADNMDININDFKIKELRLIRLSQKN